MKVLWFTNTSSSAFEKLELKNSSGGWLHSMEKEIIRRTDIELAVGFYCYKKVAPFKYENTHFYPIYRSNKSTKFKRFLNRLFPKNNDNIEVKSLLKVINDYEPDLIHVHGTEDNFGLVQKHTTIPVVITIQGILNSISQKYFAGVPKNIVFRYEGIIKKITASSIRITIKELNLKAKRERQILNTAKFINGRTDYDQRISRILAPNSHYFVVNEVLRSSFYQCVWDKECFEHKIQIVTTISGGLYKGFETIINTAQILEKNTDLKFVWKVIGLIENINTVNIVKKWKKVKLKDLNIKLAGSMNEKEIVETLRQSDIYCQVSHIDNSPNSLCEAMILGMPCVATFAGGTSSLLKNGTEGILIQEGDPWAMAGAILEMVNNEKRAFHLGKNARKVAIERHDKNKIVSDLLKVYESIISKES